MIPNEYTNYGQMIAEVNRGGLSIPRDSVVYFTYYCYIAFTLQQESHPTCQKNYISYFIEIDKFALHFSVS